MWAFDLIELDGDEPPWITRSTGRALEMGCSISDPGMTGCSKSTALLSSCNACRWLMFAAALA
jgi:hypothetical protein